MGEHGSGWCARILRRQAPLLAELQGPKDARGVHRPTPRIQVAFIQLVDEQTRQAKSSLTAFSRRMAVKKGARFAQR